MTSAEFIAVCFWPVVILFGVLLVTVRDDVLPIAEALRSAL